MLSRPSFAARKAFTALPGPFGSIVVSATWKGIERVRALETSDRERMAEEVGGEWHEPHAHPHLLAAAQWIDAYFAGRPAGRALPDVAFDLGGTPFQRRVWEIIAAIPFGASISYSELATKAGRPSAIRAAASACGDNPVPLLIPCHRVLAKDGGLGGFSMLGGTQTKAWLLGHEAEMARMSEAVTA